VLLTSPLVTAIVLAGMLLAAVGLSMVFEKRSFCRYLCPLRLHRLYSQVAPIELRIKHKPVCVTCDGKPCYNGSAEGYDAPGRLSRRHDQEYVLRPMLECIRTCRTTTSRQPPPNLPRTWNSLQRGWTKPSSPL